MPILPALGSLIADKYRVEALLGEGGMGAVFRARHELMDMAVAIKWLRPSMADDPASRDRFIREARAMARLRHPNVIHIYDVGVHQGALFLVMELLHGESFEAVLERGKMAVPGALRLIIESMQGVAAAHRHNIIHRDIKPENIFVVYDDHHPNGLAKVLDFGVSKLLDDGPRGLKITNTGAAMGTPLYMSFEQMNGAADLDARTDIYSFGVLLYRALTGRLPFEADTFAALVLAINSQKPKRPKQLRPELPESIDAVVMKAMAFDRAHRHATVSELIDALTLLASTEGFLGQMTHPSAGPLLLTPRTPTTAAATAGDAASSTPPVNVRARREGQRAPDSWNLRRGLVSAGLGLLAILLLASVYGLTKMGSRQPASSSAKLLQPKPVPVEIVPASSASQPPALPNPSVVPPEPVQIVPAPSPVRPASPSTGARRIRHPHPDVVVALPAQEPPAKAAPPTAQPATPPTHTTTGTRTGILQRERL